MQRRLREVVATLFFCVLLMLAASSCGDGNSAVDDASAPTKDSDKPGSNLAEQRRNEKNLEQIEEARRKAEEEERETRKALARAEDALDGARAVGNRHNEGAAMCDVAIYRLRLGSESSARELWLKGAAILNELGDTIELELLTTEMYAACKELGVSPFDERDPD